MMQVKEYLNTVSRLNRIIQNKLSELHQFKELSISIPAVDNKERVQTTPDFDKIGKVLAKIDVMERELDAKIDEYTAVKDMIIGQISDIPDEKHYNILFSKYVENKTLEKIADEKMYSFRHTTRLHSEALKDFDDRFGSTFKELSGMNDLIESRL
jgi:hypothetical protein